LAPTEAALVACNAAIAPVRHEDAALSAATGDIERLFALGFGLEQLCRDLADLAHRVEDHARMGKASTPV
jgi:hypothetical protein